MAAKKAQSWNMILQGLGTLLFLYVVWTWWSSGSGAGPWLGGAGGVWVPVFASVAVISVVSLLILTIVGFMGMTSAGMSEAVMKAVWLGGISLVALTGGTTLFLWVVIGYVLAYVGAGGQMPGM